jgi:WD40 repeat protein
MYAVPPQLLGTASSAVAVVAGTQIHSAGSYGAAAEAEARAVSADAEDVADGLLHPSLNTWRPHGELCAHIHEHKAAINAFSVSPDGSYFVSASDDGTVKLWENSAVTSQMDDLTMQLQDEPSLAQARVTYSAQSGRIVDVCTCKNT